ncbi:hypothetical protein [Streptomyces zingiberis]|uniref:hypothetical protein n=1 Tax=Streptomyces zingiberis TaxID=2053010 RepID=UPI001F0FA11F|nr:hypothetical protein [Streptomyces zingiberis]
MVADQHEPARGVMEFVSRVGHDVILVTLIDQLSATVLSTRPPEGPREVVTVAETATVGAWLRMVQEKPQAAFTLENAEQAREAPAPIRRRMAVAA